AWAATSWSTPPCDIGGVGPATAGVIADSKFSRVTGCGGRRRRGRRATPRRREGRSPPRLDPLGGQAPSRGPLSRSSKSSVKARTWSAAGAAGAAVSAEGLRDLVYPGVAPRAVLQRQVPDGRRPLSPLEGAAALPPDDRRAGLSLCAKSSPARAPGAAADARPGRSSLSRPRVGH